MTLSGSSGARTALPPGTCPSWRSESPRSSAAGRRASSRVIEGKGITILDPAETELVADASPQFRDSRLCLESLLRQSPPTGDDIWIGHKAAIDDLPYQLDPAIQALGQTRQRILMADAVGLGKTIEVGILLAELIRRGRGKRILTVVTKSMMAQFQKELWSRFAIPLVRLDSTGLDRIRTRILRIPTNANPFHYFDRSIISIDTFKQNNEYRVHLENSWWDVIVIDEAHNVAVRGGGKSQRARLAELLSSRSDTLIMASATPYDGRPESFASLMNMLNPTAIADAKHYGPADIKGLFLRRFKKDIQQQVAGSFLERVVTRHPSAASTREEAHTNCSLPPILNLSTTPGRLGSSSSRRCSRSRSSPRLRLALPPLRNA